MRKSEKPAQTDPAAYSIRTMQGGWAGFKFLGARDYHEVRFDATDLSSGVYFYRLQVRPLDSAIGRDAKSGAGDFVQTRKLLLLR